MFRTLLASLVVLAVGVGVLTSATDGFRAYTTETARRIRVQENPPLIPPITLQTADGSTTSFGELRGRWLLVDFIYTRCMTFCLLQGDEFAKLQRQLAEPIAAGKLALLSISFDIERDDPAALTDYLHRHRSRGPGWIAALPTSPADLATLMRAFGVTAVPDGMNGFVHNVATALVSPEGTLVKIVDWDAPQEAASYVIQRLPPSSR